MTEIAKSTSSFVIHMGGLIRSDYKQNKIGTVNSMKKLKCLQLASPQGCLVSYSLVVLVPQTLFCCKLQHYVAESRSDHDVLQNFQLVATYYEMY